MGFDRSRLPAPIEYYPSRGLTLTGRGRWRTAGCPFHGSHDSLRVNVESGAFVCMAMCGARGGDVMAFERAISGDGFVECAKRLGAWIEDGKPTPRRRPAPFTARDALEVAAFELHLGALAMTSFAATRREPTDTDLQRLRLGAARLLTILDWIKS